MVVNTAGAKTGLARTDSLTAFRVRRLDDLFGANGSWSGEALAFGHFDVEGAELDLLRGARWVISRDRPIFTVEVPTRQTSYAQQLLDEIASLGYGALVVPEKCGDNADCRNMICLPTERAAWLLRRLPLLASGSYPVSNSSLLHQPIRWQRQASQEHGLAWRRLTAKTDG